MPESLNIPPSHGEVDSRAFSFNLGFIGSLVSRTVVGQRTGDSIVIPSSLPTISIVTPSYNQGAFLEGTICSVLGQGYPSLEYIVVDGGSSDLSVDVIRRYADRLKHWESVADRGQSHAINKGMSYASGEILAWLNSDDRLEPGALMTVARAVQEHPEAQVFVGAGRKINVLGQQVYYKEPRDMSFEGLCQWMSGNNFMQPSCFFRRSAWTACGPLDESIHIAMDVDLWLKMSKSTIFHKIDALLSTAIYHPNAKTAAMRQRMVVDCALVIIKNGGERFGRAYLDRMADRLAHLEWLSRQATVKER